MKSKIRIKPKLILSEQVDQETPKLVDISPQQSQSTNKSKIRIKDKQQPTSQEKSEVVLRIFKESQETTYKKLVFEFSDSDMSEHVNKKQVFNVTDDDEL